MNSSFYTDINTVIQNTGEYVKPFLSAIIPAQQKIVHLQQLLGGPAITLTDTIVRVSYFDNLKCIGVYFGLSNLQTYLTTFVELEIVELNKDPILYWQDAWERFYVVMKQRIEPNYIQP